MPEANCLGSATKLPTDDVSIPGIDQFMTTTGMSEDIGESGQWDQYLDKLGIWDGGVKEGFGG